MSSRNSAGVRSAFILALAAAGLSGAASGAARANDLATNAPTAVAPAAPAWGGFFIGAGVAFNHFRGNDGNIYATGLSRVYYNNTLAATGYATGGTDVPLRSRNNISPVGQIGYISAINGTPWLWGVKVTYNYGGGDADARNTLVPQDGGFTAATPGTTMAGKLLVHQYKVTMTNQIALLPVIGYSFGPAALYAGAGPAAAQTRGEMNGVVGFADINGQHQDVTGSSVSFAKNRWVAGYAATVGVIWKLDQNWFIDANYTYAQTRKTRAYFTAPFENPSKGYTYTGVGFGNYHASTVNHAISVSLNYVF